MTLTQTVIQDILKSFEDVHLVVMKFHICHHTKVRGMSWDWATFYRRWQDAILIVRTDFGKEGEMKLYFIYKSMLQDQNEEKNFYALQITHI